MSETTSTKTVIQNLVVQPSRVEYADVAVWRDAINRAKRGDRTNLYNLFENILTDPVLANAAERRVSAVTNAEITFLRNGESVPAIDDLIDTPEFEHLLREIALTKAWGKSAIELSFTPAFKAFSFPRKHIKILNFEKKLSERRRVIVAKQSDTSGVDYTNDPYVLDLGEDDDLGYLLHASLYVIYKRGGFGDWAQFLEVFGMPFLIGFYDSQDPEMRNQVFEALKLIGSNPVAALPQGSNIDVRDRKTSGDSALFKDFYDVCNEAILISVLGNIMTTLNGSSRSQSEVHLDQQREIAQADKRYVQRVLNHRVVPMLVARGYDVAGGFFSFPDKEGNMPVKEQVDLALKLRSEGIGIPDSFFYDITGFPKDEAPAKKDDKPDDKPKEDNKPDDKTKPKPKNKLSDFFGNAPTRWSGATLNLGSLLTGSTVTLSSDYSIDVNSLVQQAINELYNDPSKRNELINKHLFEVTYTALVTGIGQELKVKDTAFADEFRHNTAVFAAFKNHLQTKEMVALLTDENGELVPFYKFKREALKLSQQYNVQWLRTEYNTAVRAARAAANLKKFRETEHLYPNLEYMESRAAHKRASHEEYVGTILPMNHQWWSGHMPPSDWNCQCWVRQTDKEPTEVPTGEYVNPAFANNPAETASFVKLTETAYYTESEAELREKIRREAKRLQKEILKQKRKEALKEAKKLIGKTIFHKKAAMEISFTVKGINDAINKPFDEYFAKMDAISGNLKELILKSEYVGFKDNLKPNKKPHALRYHYFETVIGKTPALLVVEEDKWGKFKFYSISIKKENS